MCIRLGHLSKTFHTSDGPVCALEDLSLDVGRSEFVSVVGPSGCGKTTLLRLIAGLIEPSSGEMTFDGAWHGGPETALVFQEHGLFPWMTVLDNVAFGLEARGVARPERHARARALVERIGLRTFADRYPHQLSVGMRQRVALARAFIIGPSVLLLDEPFGALDAQTALVMQAELLGLWSQNRPSVVHVTHNVQEAVALADRVIVMTDRPGRIREEIRVPVERAARPAGDARIEEIKWRIWKSLEHEVRKNLGPTGAADALAR
jgi:NitT/TauT family transport system ATP-binding protein